MLISHSPEVKSLFFLLSASARITGTVPEADFSAVVNETISLVCNVEGSPAPTATWSKVGGECRASYE